MKPAIYIHTSYLPGYGGPPEWSVRVIYENTLLDVRRHISSEFGQGIIVAEFRAKWDREWEDAAFAEAIAGKPAASSLCDQCGGNTLDGLTTLGDKRFCRRCEQYIPAYKAELIAQRDRMEQRFADERRQSDEARYTYNRARMLNAFHWTGGWYFKRNLDGSVNIFCLKNERGYAVPDLTIPANEWALIVCSMSGS